MKASLMSAGSSLLGTGIGLATAKWQDKRQREQNKMMMQDARVEQQHMGRFNYDQAMKMWEATGYGAQKKQMKDAGLNAGLMYGGTGSGGTTTGGQGASVAGGQASSGELGQGMALGLQGAMMQSQIDLNKSQATKNRADAEATGGYKKEQSSGQLGLLIEQTNNVIVKTAGEKLMNDINEIEKRILSATEGTKIDFAGVELDRALEELRSAVVKADIDEATKGELIMQATQDTIEQDLRIWALNIGIDKTEAETKNLGQQFKLMGEQIVQMRNDRSLGWEKLGNEQKQTAIKKKLQEFMTSSAAYIKQGAEAGKAVSEVPLGFIDRLIKMVDALVPL